MNYLCLDYGDRKTGIAIAISPLAEPLTTLNTQNIFQKLPDILNKHNIQIIIIGNCPSDFKIQLKTFGKLVIQVDETLTTIDATKALFHTTPKRRKSQIHAASAAIMLQNYLDSKTKKP